MSTMLEMVCFARFEGSAMMEGPAQGFCGGLGQVCRVGVSSDLDILSILRPDARRHCRAQRGAVNIAESHLVKRIPRDYGD